MSAPDSLAGLQGAWTGEGTLIRPWITPPESSYRTTATVAIVAGGFLRVDYTWSDEGTPQDGLLLLTEDKGAGVSAVWVDSWHQSQSFLISTGSRDPDGFVSVRGTYPAPPGPDWGWRTVVSVADGGFEIVMYNISPEGEEALAVRNRYGRAS